MRLLNLLISCIFLLSACQLTENVEQASPQQILQAQARISPKDQALLLQKIDTLLAGDTIIFQGDISPSRGTKTNDHWWEIDGSIRREEFAFKYSFTEAGIHRGVFYVIDRFGDTLSDTCTILVSRLPSIQSLLLPFKGSLLVDARSPSGIHFAWQADSGGAAAAMYRFRLWAEPCVSNDKRSLLLDSVTSFPFLDWWKPLSELCPYSWSVQISNQLGFTGSFALESQFSTKSNSPNNAVQWYSEMDSLLLMLNRFGELQTDSLFLDSGVNRIEGLEPGEYKSILLHPFRSGYQAETTYFHISEGLLTNLGSLSIQDVVAPKVTCISCYGDTTTYTNTDLKLVIAENGSGISPTKTRVYLNSNPIPSIWKKDTLMIPPLSWQVSKGIHSLLIHIQDNAGNLQSKRYWMVVPE